MRHHRHLLPLPLAFLAAAVALLLVACGSGSSDTLSDGGSEEGEKVAVVATYSILGDMVANVGADAIELTTLVGPDGDVHTFEPTPESGAAIADADVVFENGLGFESWLDDLYESSGSDAARVVVSEGIEPATLVVDGVEEEDPHIWHDVANAKPIVRRLRDGLIEADPDNAETYQATPTSTSRRSRSWTPTWSRRSARYPRNCESS